MLQHGFNPELRILQDNFLVLSADSLQTYCIRRALCFMGKVCLTCSKGETEQREIF